MYECVSMLLCTEHTELNDRSIDEIIMQIE